MEAFDRLAALSHSLERLALALANDDPDEKRAAAELHAVAAGEREALALALSYLFRRQELGDDSEAVTRAIVLLTTALWDMPHHSNGHT